MKKLLILTMVFIMAGQAVFAGGGRAAGGSGEKKTIVFYHWDGGTIRDRRLKQIEIWESRHPDVKIEENMVNSDYLPKLNTMVAANNAPDLFQLYEYLVSEWGEKGTTEDLKPFYNSIGIEPENFFLSGDLFTSGGHVWGVGMGGGVILLWYNKELFRQAGVNPPPANINSAWTWDQFVDAAKKLTKDSSGRTPNDAGFNYDNVVQFGVVTPTWWQPNLSFLYSAGTSIADPAGRELRISNSAGVRTIQALADLALKHKVAPTFAMASSNVFSNRATLLMNGQAAMLIEGQWNLGSYEDENFDVGVGVLPAIGPRSVSMAWDNGLVAKKGASREALEFHSFLVDSNEMVAACKAGNIPLSGLLPVTRNTLTDPALNREWASMLNPAFSSVVQEVLLNGTFLAENVTLKGFSEIVDQYIYTELDKVWMGEETAQQCLDRIQRQAQSMLRGAYQ
jgi:multiple sugar transport system substrate-binding protein